MTTTSTKARWHPKGALNPFFGKRHTDEAKIKIGKASLGRKHSGFSEDGIERLRTTKLGKKNPAKRKEVRLKMSLAKKGKKKVGGYSFPKGPLHPNWKGGCSEHKHCNRTLAYRTWRGSVFARDNWTCKNCGSRGKELEAHHIKSWAKFIDLRYDINNGVTLCVECHKLTDNYKGKK